MSKLKSKSLFVCQSCGSQRPKWEGRCTDCGSWNSLVEEVVESGSSSGSRGWMKESSATQILSLDQVVTETQLHRWTTSIKEMDRVLGGGVVPGSFVLVGGDPGIGKSTLLLQMAGSFATTHQRSVLYISGEESVSQTALRAQRLGVRSTFVKVACESNLEIIDGLIRDHKPDLLIVDSIQTLFLPELSSAPGSVSQVRESAAHLMSIAKSNDTAIFLVGHVTKEGNLAGPKVLEHMVDTVLSFEGERGHPFRLLRSIKNRFGATHELGVFEMREAGLMEVVNPSELFLQERGEQPMGSSIFATIEGSRPLLCEIQALTTSTHLAMPRRTSVGFDLQRVHLLSAVLEKHLKLKLSSCDLFVNVVGGLKISEPAADLAVCAAIISTQTNKTLGPRSIFMGEVGLTGEIRGVSQIEQRLRESLKLGFNEFVLPESNHKHLEPSLERERVKYRWVKHVRDLNLG